jgi:hypothetical protein
MVKIKRTLLNIDILIYLNALRKCYNSPSTFNQLTPLRIICLSIQPFTHLKDTRSSLNRWQKDLTVKFTIMDPEHSLVNPPQHTIPIQFKEVTPLQRALFRNYLFILMLIMFRSNNNMWKWAMLSKFRRNMPLPLSAVSPKRGQHSPFPYHPACHYAAQGLILTMNHHEDVKICNTYLRT